MEITVNKETMVILPDFTVSNLLEQLNFSKSVAVFVNGKQLLLAEYDYYICKENDNIKVIKPLGGG